MVTAKSLASMCSSSIKEYRGSPLCSLAWRFRALCHPSMSLFVLMACCYPLQVLGRNTVLSIQCRLIYVGAKPPPNVSRFLGYFALVYTTQVNSAFRARWLASLEVISQVLFTSEQPNKNKMAFVGILSQIKSLFGPLVIQLVWYILKQLFTSVSVKVVDICLAPSRLGKYPPLFTSTSVNNC